MSTCFLFLHLFTPKLCKKMSICFHVSIFSPPDIRMGENLLPYTLNPPYSLLHTPTPPSQYFLPVTPYLLFYTPYYPDRKLKAIFPSLRKKWGVGGGEWGVTLKLVGREILSVVKLGGEKWEVGRGGWGVVPSLFCRFLAGKLLDPV
jgi:hypothetical protein